MLIACDSCHSQYDIGSLPHGSTVRCTCGEPLTVAEQPTHQAPVQRCSACGGAIPDGARSCEFCGADVTLGERGWGDACPECFARLVSGARFCSACGVEIRPSAIRKSAAGETCPRCDATMSVVEIPGGSFVECTGCGGVWLDEKVFERTVEEGEEKSALAGYFARSRPDETRRRQEGISPGESEIRYLPCPVCGQLMNRKNFARYSGVVVDWCRGHGYWFDTHELERIVDFVSSGGLEDARRREIERRKNEAEVARIRSLTTSSRLSSPSSGELGIWTRVGGSRSPGVIEAVLSFLRVVLREG